MLPIEISFTDAHGDGIAILREDNAEFCFMANDRSDGESVAIFVPFEEARKIANFILAHIGNEE